MNHILLYSKYSRSCLRLLDTIEELNSVMQFGLVCIDNKDIRKRICSSKSFEVTKVPCMLILGQDGTVEKYDGEKVFLWVNEVLNNIKKQSQSQSQSQSQPQPQPQPQIQHQHQPQPQIQPQIQHQPRAQPKAQSQIQYEDEDEDELVRPPKSNRKKSKVSAEMTKIEDLDDIEEEEEVNDDEEEEVKIKRPPIPIRNGPGNYSFENDMEIEPQTNNYKKPKKVKKSGDSEKGNIMDAAMAMRQEREKENKSGQ